MPSRMRRRTLPCLLTSVALLGAAGHAASAPPSGWSPAAPVAKSAHDAVHPRVAVDPRGHAHVVWPERDAQSRSRVWYATNESGAFGPAERISDDAPKHAFSPAVAADASAVYVVWQANPAGDNVEVWLRKRSGGKWGDVVNASRTSASSTTPAVEAAPAGPVVAWQEACCTSGNNEIFLAAWTGSGFGDPVNLSETPDGPKYGSVNAALAVSANGDATAAWPDSITGEYYIHARRRVGTEWKPPEEISKEPTGPSTPGIVAGKDGRVSVVYHANTSGGRKVLAQTWDGKNWGAPVALPGGIEEPTRPKIAIDGAGTAHVVVEAKDGIYATHDESGNWKPWERLSTAGSRAKNADIAYGHGVVVAVWNQRAADTEDNKEQTDIFFAVRRVP